MRSSKNGNLRDHEQESSKFKLPATMKDMVFDTINRSWTTKWSATFEHYGCIHPVEGRCFHNSILQAYPGLRRGRDHINQIGGYFDQRGQLVAREASFSESYVTLLQEESEILEKVPAKRNSLAAESPRHQRTTDEMAAFLEKLHQLKATSATNAYTTPDRRQQRASARRGRTAVTTPSGDGLLRP